MPSTSYPVDNTHDFRCPVPFSAADFFRDSPWLNVPQHRKADILVEPLYPRLGLLGGASQEGKMSKLAALAAARKKKNSEKLGTATATDESLQSRPSEQKPAPRSLSERLAVNNNAKVPVRAGGLSGLARGNRRSGGLANLNGTSDVSESDRKAVVQPSGYNGRIEEEVQKEKPEEHMDLRAAPSTFAATIVGNEGPSVTPEPSHLLGRSFEVMHIYHPDITEAFDFAGPSPDDVVLNAQSASKGLPIRGTR